MGVLLFLFGLVLAGVAIVAFFKPMPKLRMATRQGAAMGLLLSLASCIAGVSIMPPATDAPVQADVPAPANKSVPTPVPDDKAALQSETEALWTSVKDGIADCDQAATKAIDALGGISKGQSNVYETYRLTTSAEGVCERASLTLSDLKPPEHAKGEVKKSFKQALETCSYMATSKQTAMSSASAVLNGDMSPKAVNKTTDDMTMSGVFSTKCALEFVAASQEAGVELPELKQGAKAAD